MKGGDFTSELQLFDYLMIFIYYYFIKLTLIKTKRIRKYF